MRPHEKANLIKAGAFATALLGLGVIFTLTLSKDKSIFDKIIQLHAKVENAENLKTGAAVKLKGIKIGSVSELYFEKINTIDIVMNVNDSYLKWIKKDSYISIKTQGMLGDKYVEILGGSDEKNSVVDGDIIAIEKGKDLNDFINKGEDILVTANRVLYKLDGVFDILLKDQKLDKMIDNLANSSQKMGHFFSSKNQENFSNFTMRLSNVMTRIDEGPGTLHSLLYDNTVHEDIQTLLGGAQRNKLIKYFIRESIKKSEQIEKGGK